MLDAAVAIQPAEQVIVVTGRGLEEEDKLAATRVIDRVRIERSASGRIENVLRDVAGLASFRRSDSRSAHPTSQGLTLRGLGGNAASRVTMGLDGVPQADPFGGWIAFTALDPHAIDRIRLLRGGGAGLGNVAGTIDVDSRAIAGEQVAASLTAGSRSALDARVLTGTMWKAGFASLSGSFARGAGFVPIVGEDRGSADERAPYRQRSVRARLVQSIAPGTEAQLNLSTYRDRRTRGTDFTDNRQRGTDASLRLVGTGDTRWSALVYVQDRRFDSEFAAVGPGRVTTSETLDQRVPARGWGARVDVAKSTGPFALSGGSEWRRMAGETHEQFRFVAGAATRLRDAGGENSITGLFGRAHWSQGGWSASLDARADHWRLSDGHLVETDLAATPLTDIRFDQREGVEPSGRVAIGRALGTQAGLRAAAYRGWRLPTLNELYRPFRTGADATAANGELDPERLRGIEAGIDWALTRQARLSGTAFANRLGGAIANVTVGAGPGLFPGVGFVAAGGVYRVRQNVDAITSRGIEIDGEWTRGPWRGVLSYALTDARVKANGAAAALDGKRPAQVARHSGSISLGWEHSLFGLNGTARFTGRQYEDDLEVRRLPAALTFDAGATVAVSSRIDLDLKIENALDKQVVATLANDGTRERALPRALWVGLRVRRD
jgi:outer membrane receptor protein involved in Fe transport